MNVEQQGPNECMLATIAALAGAALDDVREEGNRQAAAYGYESWNGMYAATFHGPTYWQEVVARVCARFDSTSATGWLVSRPVAWPAMSASIPEGDTTIHSLSSRLRSLPATGRGAVRVRYGQRLHIMPYENGMLTDPQTLWCGTLADWRRSSRWHVVSITHQKGAS